MGLPAAAAELPLSARTADPTGSNAACATVGEGFPHRSTLAAAALFASLPGRAVTSPTVRVANTACAEAEWNRVHRMWLENGGTAGQQDGPANNFVAKHV
jgi:hypothetical protein